MTPEEQNLDMLVAELDRENRLLRARNERLEKEAEQRKPWVGLTDEDCKGMSAGDRVVAVWADRTLREKNK